MDNDTQVLAISLCPRLRVSNDVIANPAKGHLLQVSAGAGKVKNEVVARGVA